ncbi:AAA family ATPase [Variovorax arabinosiphilus]|uniref:AAA family ATPase n=1 Tax=Variovorax arabinosiphilus TaxID=3053498 RepID=UPI002576FB0D|nr:MULTISPECIES: AAA family ATPase [unclassified Variovorax]MDM0118690.1 AAA family ATPase [Variovorax sp. J2L1-78]MDM0129115.1 AAA family ATPase [Variovorax sp. J2L1-63]MDM0233098.1 AAA family ATPase [Variovorax sp. J2R1-6]
MYFTPKQIVQSIQALAGVHSFHGITFVACKIAGLPVGKETVFPLDAHTDSFLKQHHRLDPGSDWFFQPFKSADREKKWVRPDYSAKGLQSVNTRSFLGAFIHPHNSRIWSWAEDYVSFLASKLPKGQRIPAFDLAVWLYRERDWPEDAVLDDVVTTFVQDYSITSSELASLFDPVVPLERIEEVFQDDVSTWEDLRELLPAPPDARPDEGGTLSYLATKGLGPAHEFILQPADRLSLITGDNGLGKSFLLEAAWWALTGTWAGRPSYPNPGRKNSDVAIAFAISGEKAKATKKTIAFDWKTLSWPMPKERPTIAGLIVYARVDGSFAVWDPARQSLPSNHSLKEGKTVFSSKEVWDGLPGRIEGLVRDWVRWQSNPQGEQFKSFELVLAKLSPPDLGRLRPGPTVRIPDDPRDIPTLIHPYGETPIVYASAGVRRIVTLAYLIVWAWHEHLIAADMAQAAPQRRMVVLVDELEAHLHPKWQRSFLPALMELSGLLAPTLKAQYIVATHSPLVMASSESVFDATTDKLFHLDLEVSQEVSLKEVEYVAFGDVSSWLTSPVFELRHARSNEGESAIEAAKSIQLKGTGTASEIRAVHERLKLHIASDDRFWPRWVAFAERFGVAD